MADERTADKRTADAVLDLWLVRHGATVPNAQKRYPHQHEDAALSAQGEAQVRRLSGLLPESATAFASPARRARETALRTGFARAQPHDALCEAHFGVMAGHTWAELEAEYGAAPGSWIEALADPTSGEGPPGGESGREFHGRVRGWLGGLPPHGAVVAFTHAGPIRAVLGLTLGLSAVDLLAGRATLLRRAGQAWWLMGLNWPAPET